MLEVENLRPIYLKYGAVYNAETGFYELNGLTDITEAQMFTIFRETHAYKFAGNLDNYFFRSPARTNLSRNTNVDSVNKSYPLSMVEFARDSRFEVLVINRNNEGDAYAGSIGSMNTAFYGCKALRKIIGVLWVRNLVFSEENTIQFHGCSNLEEVRIKGFIGKSLHLSDCPLLSYETLDYLVANAANTEAATVTVHGEVYAKLSGTASEYGDHTQEEWTALMTAAAEKQISFATV